MLPLIALIGRPNVGKSTLFNRMIRANRAITHDRPGVTRDRMYGEVRRGGKKFAIVDTGGVTLDEKGAAEQGQGGTRGFEAEILSQARLAVEEAAAIVLVMDGRDGLTPFDERLARFVRESNKPVIVAVNKVDGSEQADIMMSDFHSLGMDSVAVSAAHGFGLRELEEEMMDRADEARELLEDEDDAGPDPEKGLRIAMLGRPNAGKSSLVNAILGEERLIVSELAGTTRDSIDVTVEVRGKRWTFVDTAGIRRRTRIVDSVEKFTVNAALKSARKADITIMALDINEGLTQQDKRLLAYLDREKLPFMVVANKVDTVEKDQIELARRHYRKELSFCSHVPLVLTSAVRGDGLDSILPLAGDIWDECAIRVSTGLLNRAMKEVLEKHQPPVVKRIRAKFYYLTQTGVRPPTFVFFVNDPERVKESYMRYLENNLRKMFGIQHAPMKVLYRASHEKRTWKKKKVKR